MPFSLNRVVLIGTIGKDAETRAISDDASVSQFSLATDRSFKKDGNWVNETDWHNIVAWNLSEYTLKGIKKGKKLGIEGRVQTRSYEKDGEKRYITEIIANNIILIDKSESSEHIPADQKTASMYNVENPESPEEDDGLPF